MNAFVGDEILTAPAGYYWYRFTGQCPAIMYISQIEARTFFGFNYPDEAWVSHSKPFPEDYKGLDICGPILQPQF